jgi:excisionase family DNA binding protein
MTLATSKRDGLEAIQELIPLRTGGLMIGVPYETMRRYVKLRIIPYYKIGGRLKVHKDELREWYRARKVTPLASGL